MIQLYNFSQWLVYRIEQFLFLCVYLAILTYDAVYFKLPFGTIVKLNIEKFDFWSNVHDEYFLSKHIMVFNKDAGCKLWLNKNVGLGRLNWNLRINKDNPSEVEIKILNKKKATMFILLYGNN